MPHTWVIVSGPSDSPEQAEEDANVIARAAVESYVNDIPDAEEFEGFFPVTDDWIQNQIVAQRYQGKVTQGGSTRFEHAIELRFDSHDREQIELALQNARVQQRLGALGLMVFLGLAGLISSSAVFGFASRRVARRSNQSVN